MRRLAALVLAIAVIGCGTPTTQSDVPQPSPSPVRTDEFQQDPGDYRLPGTPPPPGPVVGGGNGSAGSGQSGGTRQCTGAAPTRPCGRATAQCNDGTYTCAISRQAACTGSSVKCVYCPGSLCSTN